MAKKKSEEKAKILKMRDIPAEEFITTGIPELDEIMGGGFPRRRITQLWGVPGVGKSYLLGNTLSKLPKDAKALYVDSEFSLNRTRMEEMGVDMGQTDYMADSKLEDVANYIVEHIHEYDIIVIDTLAKLTPMTIQENDVGVNTIGLAARQIAHFEARLRPELFKSKAAIIGINQARANLGYGAGESKPAGGYAWNHTVDLSLKMSRVRNNTNSHVAKIKIDKSRVSIPWKEIDITVDYK